jgi:hypothetical protein
MVPSVASRSHSVSVMDASENADIVDGNSLSFYRRIFYVDVDVEEHDVVVAIVAAKAGGAKKMHDVCSRVLGFACQRWVFVS